MTSAEGRLGRSVATAIGIARAAGLATVALAPGVSEIDPDEPHPTPTHVGASSRNAVRTHRPHPCHNARS